MLVEIEKINIDPGKEFLPETYKIDGFYHNLQTGNVLFVKPTLNWSPIMICTINDLNNIPTPEKKDLKGDDGTVTEKFALQLTETIINNLKQ